MHLVQLAHGSELRMQLGQLLQVHLLRLLLPASRCASEPTHPCAHPPMHREMMAIVDAAHVPAPGARDLKFEELNVHGPLFQYWVLLKVRLRLVGRPLKLALLAVCGRGKPDSAGCCVLPLFTGRPTCANRLPSRLPPFHRPCSACSRCTTACPTTSSCAWPSRCWSALCLAPWPGTRVETRELIAGPRHLPPLLLLVWDGVGVTLAAQPSLPEPVHG